MNKPYSAERDKNHPGVFNIIDHAVPEGREPVIMASTPYEHCAKMIVGALNGMVAHMQAVSDALETTYPDETDI